MTLLDITMLDAPVAGTESEAARAATELRYTGQWRLARIELLNWGTFNGQYTIDVARQGHLFTGASGSGKSSLLDAIAAVLTPDKWLRFNAAAQDASSRSDDRSLVSYVRGAWSKESDENYDRAVSTYLRKSTTWSGVLLRYENEVDAPITLARLFYLRGASVDKTDLKDLCFLDRGDVRLEDFGEYVTAGIDARRIKAAWPEAVVTTGGSHAPFYSRMRRLFGIGTQNALHLLHKTQSAKNLGSLDQLFRSFMLDEPATFARAKNAVEQFGELSQAHRHVVDLRRQADELRALDVSIAAYEKAEAVATEAERLGALIEPFQEQLTLQLAEDDRGRLLSEHARAVAESQRAEAVTTEAEEHASATQRRELQLGGADAVQQRERVNEAVAAETAVAERWKRFVNDLSGVGIDTPPSDAAGLAELRDTSRRELEQEPPAASHDHGDNRAFFEAKNELNQIDRELHELKMRKSNLPPELLVARSELAAELGLAEAALPFAGELIEVSPEHAAWSGAIERVLYPLASALLVRDDLLREVRRRVESRNVGARLVFEAVAALPGTPRSARSERSLLHRILVSSGPFHDWLTTRLSAEFDYACVDHPDQLDTVERGVTIGGQVKKSARRYEKNDRYSIDDRRRWILGADNEAKIELLLERRRGALRRHDAADDKLKRAAADRDAATRRRAVLDSVLRQDWTELDRTAAAQLVRSRRARLAELTTGNVKLQDAIAASQSAAAALKEAREAQTDAAVLTRGLAADLATVEAVIERIRGRVAHATLDQADVAALDERYRSVQRKIDRASVEATGRKVADALHAESRAARARLATAQSSFVEGASAFKARWDVASADLTAQIEDRDGYRALLAGIEARGLPEHEGNFLRLLKEKSRDLIGHLASDIRDAPKQVVERISPVNASLGRSQFDDERYLRIDVRTQRSSEVLAFMADLKTIVDGGWDDDDLAAAERRFAVLNALMTRLASSENADLGWKRRCLDTREHVTFMAYEVDPTGRVMNVHDSSAGLSGGQRQKLVIFCLAAALRYQLAAEEDALPSYATIILDEAFDKADSRYTRMAMDVFVEFGFHMILATPQKLLQTIEPYVGAVTTIDNPTRKLSLTASMQFRTEG